MVAFAQEAAPALLTRTELKFERGERDPVVFEAGAPIEAVVPGDVEMSPEERKALSCEKINQLEAAILANCELGEYPLHNTFIAKNGGLDSGLYVREAFLPVGVYTTEIHRTEHPYAILKGRARVWTQETGWVDMVAPMSGVTKRGTRRVFIVHEPMVFITYHATNTSDADEVKRFITLPHKIMGDITQFGVEKAFVALEQHEV